jgi:hypothetical protein
MCQVTSLPWLVNLKPAVEDVVAAVEGVGVGVDSPSEMSQEHYLARVVKLGPVRTSKAMYLPLDLATKEKMVTCYTKEKLTLYLGTNYGDDACQEWLSEKQLVLQEPTYPDSVLVRHEVWEKAMIDRVTKMVTSLGKQLQVIKAKLLLTPKDLNLLKSEEPD